MRLVDTSAWIEWLMETPTGKLIEPLIPERGDWLVPTIVQLELAKWLTRELGEDRSDQVLAFTQMCQVVALDTQIALAAAELSAQHRLATADAVIYATALTHEAEVLTCDAHFEGLEGVRYLAKVGG